MPVYAQDPSAASLGMPALQQAERDHSTNFNKIYKFQRSIVLPPMPALPRGRDRVNSAAATGSTASARFR
jgi:hypothetical protein